MAGLRSTVSFAIAGIPTPKPSPCTCWRCGAESNSIPATCWDAWKRPMRDLDGIFFIDSSTPIFVHQYSHAWFDFRNRRDRYANYFHNSQRATAAHRLYCMDLAGKFPWYGPDMWGVTASDSRGGYRAWASPAQQPDGTLVPCAAGGSIVFLPDRCGAVLENMLERYGSKVWSPFGFVDAFQPDAGWFSRYVIGINLGIMLLMAENSRSGAVWSAVMSTPEAGRAMTRSACAPSDRLSLPITYSLPPASRTCSRSGRRAPPVARDCLVRRCAHFPAPPACPPCAPWKSDGK